MKSKKPEIKIFDKIKNEEIVLDSKEELEFYEWCIEGYNNGLLNYIYHPQTFILSEEFRYDKIVKLKNKEKIVNKKLLGEHVYTPDFLIELNDKFCELFADSKMFMTIEKDINKFKEFPLKCYIDIKGSFQRFDGARSFSINQKWMWSKYSIYINKIVPEKLFKETWVPYNATLTPKTKQIREKYKDLRLITDILKS